MPRFVAPSKFVRIFSAELAGASGEARQRMLADLEDRAEKAIQANMKEGFFSSPAAMIDQQGNLILVVATIAQQRVSGEVEAAMGMPVPVILDPPTPR